MGECNFKYDCNGVECTLARNVVMVAWQRGREQLKHIQGILVA